MGEENLKEQGSERYAGVARIVRDVGGGVSCREPSYCGSDVDALEVDATRGSYSVDENRELLRLASEASLGCGNPVALAALSPREVVLDLSSGRVWRLGIPGIGPVRRSEARPEVLFLCTHNSARYQMAEGILRYLAEDRFEVSSAGTEATFVRPLAVRAMWARLVWTSPRRSRKRSNATWESLSST